MSKRLVLGVLLILLCSVLATAAELRIDLEVLIKDKPVMDDIFNVAIYATPSGGDSLGETKIKLKSTNPTLASFTGNGVSDIPALGPAEFANGIFHLKATTNPTKISGRKYLGTMEMKINSEGGSFSVETVPSESSAISSLIPSKTYYSIYTSDFTGVRKVRIMNKNLPVCVPSSFCGSNFCGFADDGCGGYVQCNKVCSSGEVCINNFCQSAVSQLPVFDKLACQAIVDVPSSQDKVLLTKLAVTLQDWDKSCTADTDCQAGYSCTDNKCTATELSILSPIFAALTDWLGMKFASG